jgi:hypothetical protein
MDCGVIMDFRGLILMLALSVVVGCGGGSSSGGADTDNVTAVNLDDMDLSGTWQVTVETEYYNTGSGDYLYSGFYRYRMIIDDSGLGVRYRRCENEFNYNADYGVKTGDRLYLYLYEPAYQHITNEHFQQVGELTEEMYFPEQSYRRIVDLTKMSDDILDSAGRMSVSVPFVMDKTSGVCVTTHASSIGSNKHISLDTVYQGDNVSFFFSFYDTLSAASYLWNDDVYDGSQQVSSVGFGVSYELAESLWGDSWYDVESATVEIQEISDTSFRAQVSLVDEYGNEVETSFDIDPSWLLF